MYVCVHVCVCVCVCVYVSGLKPVDPDDPLTHWLDLVICMMTRIKLFTELTVNGIVDSIVTCII